MLRENWWSLNQLFICGLWSYSTLTLLSWLFTVTVCKSEVRSSSFSLTHGTLQHSILIIETHVNLVYILFIFSVSTSQEPESHFHRQSMRQIHQQIKAHAQRRLDSFVGVCAHCRYTQHITSLFISCINFTKSLPIEINIINVILKKSNRTKHIQQNCGESELHQDTERVCDQTQQTLFSHRLWVGKHVGGAKVLPAQTARQTPVITADGVQKLMSYWRQRSHLGSTAVNIQSFVWLDNVWVQTGEDYQSKNS